MEVKVYKRDGSETGSTIALDESVFGIEPNEHAVWLDVRRIQAHGRQGTHKAKERSETAGSTRKLYRQKGTGGSRAGSAKSPIRRSGGTIFGPKPHAYSLKVNKKTAKLARRSALSAKASSDAIRVVEDFRFESASTRDLKEVLGNLELQDSKVLLLTGEHDGALYRSGRNLPKVAVRTATGASTLDLMNAQVVVLQQSAVTNLVGQLAAAKKA